MKFRILVPGMLFLVILIAACVPPPVLRNDKMLNDTSLVSNEPCAAPCWKNITPGETKWTDALAIIEDDPNYDDPQTQNAQEGSAIGAQWQKKDGEACCQMVTEDGQTVSFISLRLAPESTIGQVIEAQGEPTYAIGTPVTDDQAVIYLFYPDKSLIVVTFVPGANGSITENSEVIGALYSKPDQMELSIKTSKLHAWEGYGTFEEYKADAPDSEFEVTPEITLTPTPGQ